MIPITQKILDEMVEAIVNEVSPEQVILFGSRARGEEKTGSDLDLIVVESESFGPKRSRRKESARLWNLLSRFPVSKDILVYSSEEVNRWKYGVNHIIARAYREGKVLYEKY